MAERLILASASARRRELMSAAGYRFDVAPADIEESLPAESEDPSSVAMALAAAKARHVASRTSARGRWVVGADTIVALGRRLIGKPRDAADAESILSSLSGSRHAVITGVALVESGSGRSLVRSATTWIQMRRIPQEEIRRYVAGGAALGKAGAYAIQEGGDRYVERMEGSVTNVVGLPMELLGEMLAEVRWEASAS